MKTLLCISITTLTLSVVNIWNDQHLADGPTTAQSDSPTATFIRSIELKTAKIWAPNTTLYMDDTLVLHFSTPNAPYLGVVDPQGHFFYIVYPGESALGALQPLVDSKQFISLTTLKINTSSFKADPYIYEVYANRPVFTTSGAYTFIMGENLHVDTPALLEQTIINFINIKRPTKAILLAAPSKNFQTSAKGNQNINVVASL